LSRPVRRLAARKRSPRAVLWRRAAVTIGAITLVALALGLAFAGSPARVPAGVEIAGVQVGGMDADAARATLEQRSRALADVPVTFTADGRAWRLTPSRLGVEVDWRAAVDAALRQGPATAPVRGFYRLGVRIFGADIAPSAQAYNAALDYELDKLERAIDRPHRDAELRLRGLTPFVVSDRDGRALDRDAAARVIVQSLASLQRVSPVELPVKVEHATVTAAFLAPVATQVRTALSAPVRLAIGPTRYRLPRYRVAELLDLPRNGDRELRVGGPGADRFFVRLTRAIDKKPRDADWAIGAGNKVRLVPSRAGQSVEVPETARNILRAALSTTNRVAPLVISQTPPQLTTARAREMNIHELVSAYETIYGGDANRIHNVQLVAHLIDHHLIAPGEEFSFNKTTGERTAAKGFLEAPVIINGELQTGLGGGVCQVSTTTFNAAYEAGLKITARTNHALYISHYPLGRDATVNYPDVDLRFVNDTGNWLLVRTFVGSSSLTVALYGTNPHRRVESDTAPLTLTGGAPTEAEKDPGLFVGEQVTVDSGEPSRKTSVERRVFNANGKLLYDDTWSSYYRSEPRIVRVGTKPKPVEKKKKPKPTDTGPVTTDLTGTTPTLTPPARPQTQP
jgi:vancomycin resistance protein YoaR